jgi:ABC-2 type transport system permease protein
MLRLLLQELRFRINGIIGWGLGLSFFPVVYVGMYPSFAEQMESFQELMDLAIYQAMGISMAGFEGFIASTVTNLVPVILCIYAVINGTGTLAGEEDDGRLELIVSLPIPRWQIVAVKTVALGIALFIILAWPLAMAVGMISLFLGAFSPNRRIASTIATVVVLVSYLGSNLSGMISSLEKIEKLFLFHYYEATAQALEVGQQTDNMIALLVISLVAFGLALVFFQRRNITVGAWPWRRAVISK